MPSMIAYHLDLKSLATGDLKRALRDRDHLSKKTYSMIQAELMRRGEGYHSPQP